MSNHLRKGLPVDLSAMDSLVLEYMTSEGLVDICGISGPAQAANEVCINLLISKGLCYYVPALNGGTYLPPLSWEGMGWVSSGSCL
jgi:hypothetical protein